MWGWEVIKQREQRRAWTKAGVNGFTSLLLHSPILCIMKKIKKCILINLVFFALFLYFRHLHFHISFQVSIPLRDAREEKQEKRQTHMNTRRGNLRCYNYGLTRFLTGDGDKEWIEGFISRSFFSKNLVLIISLLLLSINSAGSSNLRLEMPRISKKQFQ